MSPSRRARSASVARVSSRRLRWRMSTWDFSGSDQSLGSAAIFFSTSASWERREAASKIAPQVMDLIADGSVFAFEFFDHKFHLRRTGFNHGTRRNACAHKQRQKRDYHTYPGKQIAVPVVERGFRQGSIWGQQRRARVSFSALHHPSVGINGGGNSVVG